MLSLSAYLFRLRQRMIYGSRTPKARDLELLRAAADGRLELHQDFQAGTYEYRLDGQAVPKRDVHRADFWLNLITNPSRTYPDRQPVEKMTVTGRGQEILTPTAQASTDNLLVAARDLRWGSSVGDSQSAILAALCRSDGGERFLIDYHYDGVTLSGVVIKAVRRWGLGDGWKQDFKMWMNPDGTGKAHRVTLNVMGIQRMYTVPHPDGSLTCSEQLRQTYMIVHDTLLADMPKYADRARALRKLIGDGPVPATRQLIEQLERDGVLFRIADQRRATSVPAVEQAA